MLQQLKMKSFDEQLFILTLAVNVKQTIPPNNPLRGDRLWEGILKALQESPERRPTYDLVLKYLK